VGSSAAFQVLTAGTATTAAASAGIGLPLAGACILGYLLIEYRNRKPLDNATIIAAMSILRDRSG
jgi:hypothetical protein